MTFKLTTTVFNDGILTREDKWFETLLFIPQTRKIDFLLPLLWLQQTSTFGTAAGYTSHHIPAAAHQGCTHLCTHMCFQILGARVLLLQSKWYKVRAQNRSEQQTAITTRFVLSAIIIEMQNYLTKFF